MSTDDQHESSSEGTVSEGGSGDLNSETSRGGADMVPDTPDGNEGGEGATVDPSTPDQDEPAE